MCAVEYRRMSTENQNFSTENQAEANANYANLHGLRLVRAYADEGKSGLQLKGRVALARLPGDVRSPERDFDHILVYDVSRWGRFQDVDESAYYEFICREAGVLVHYCAETFLNDGTPLTAIVKTLKRIMAAEFSRELSARVFCGQCHVVRKGYYAGGGIPFIGLRRLLVDEHGQPKVILEKYQSKAFRKDRITLVKGPADEVALVRRIFDLFVVKRKSEYSIAKVLNADPSVKKFGRKWRPQSVNHILINEKYIGNNVFNHVSQKLRSKSVKNPPEMWIRADNSFEPIVSKEVFQKAQKIVSERRRRKSDENVVAELRALFLKMGRLNPKIIREAKLTLGIDGYQKRFGGMYNAYRLAGYEPEIRPSYTDEFLLNHLRGIFATQGYISSELIDETRGPCAETYSDRFGALTKAYTLIGYDKTPKDRPRDAGGRFKPDPRRARRRRPPC